ncbi:hypothetical protein CROQUDRAFT_38586 [Cronartium quercuum f. sp. fusiforme G11]|uniref:Uncharacterized protein n=1 Tax=Cronartium quercuum f. sp. fusiforme G11 TaxID=708437 RepID=A0A9P6NQK1_9BASI|nr:hypothetical protein CROQUDRAFT_38586 [Cronartium quercuum f. sp. fusiforme G11]
MEAEGTRRPGTVITAFTGQLIDIKSGGLWTTGASRAIEEEYWSRTEAFGSVLAQDLGELILKPEVVERVDQEFVLMKWKETNFVNCEPEESGLSIQGFYFVCLQRSTGSIEAYYYDPNASPYQRLTLGPIGHRGVAFGTIQFA